MESARRAGCRIILDRPEQDVLRGFSEWAELDGRGVAIELVNMDGDDALGIIPLAPPQPRPTIAVNGRHSEHEAIAFDLHARGFTYDRISEMMECDVQTAKTYIIRAREKNRKDSDMDEAMRLSRLTD